MTGPTIASETNGAAGASGDALAAAHAHLFKDGRLQFAFDAVKPPPPPPDWLKPLARLIEAIAPFLGWLFWGVVALVAALLIYLIVREVLGVRLGWRRRRPTKPVPADWRPDLGRAQVLLADAEALAREGRFAEAAHLVLLRGVADIDARRPGLVSPSLTSRDIARAPDLPERAKPAFGHIAEIVERSLFGGRPVGEPDWLACREAYGRLIFEEAWA